jgi:oxygen-independent coproporphyrinogen-3 oxidase
MAIGGGTPTLLSLGNMERLFSIILSMGCDPGKTPGSVEISPETCSAEKLQLLFSYGIQRISLGVQTFVNDESKSLGRRGSVASVKKTLSDIHVVGFPVVNIDLIYGIESQSEESWLYSLNQAIQYAPEEIYMYPLYVQKLTQLADQYLPESKHRTRLYRIGRDYLLDAGYKQNSMRMFSTISSNENKMPVYCCQEDGMVGFGAGARSYTKNFHYSSEYAVSPDETHKIINHYINKQDFSVIDYGIELGLEEQQRRYIIKSILRCEGLKRDVYYARYNSDPMDDYGVLRQYQEEGLLTADTHRIYLTPEGIELSDYIGPGLYSSEIQARMSAYQWK